MPHLLQTRMTDANDAKTSDAPAVDVFARRLYVVYRDETDAVAVFSYDGEWSAPLSLGERLGAFTDSAPAVAVLRSRLCVAYRGEHDHIYLITFDGSRWTPPTDAGSIINAKTSHAPSMVEYADELMVLYKHAETNELCAFCFDGNQPAPQIRITDLNGATTGGTPTVASFEDTVHIVYRTPAAPDIWTCTHDGYRASTPVSLSSLTGACPASTPSLFVWDDALHLCYRGTGQTHLRALRYDVSWACCPIDFLADLKAFCPDGFGMTPLGEDLFFDLAGRGVFGPDTDASPGDAVCVVSRAKHSSDLVASMATTPRRAHEPRLRLVGEGTGIRRTG